uniref:Uncharacterized protein n=1 Tax=Anopheles darlingi TaxID=43151 RepID=A0A2M4DE94_ANODA
MVAFRLCIGGLLLVMIHGCLLVVRSAVLLETGLRQYGVAVVAAAAHRPLIAIHHQLTALVNVAAVVVHHSCSCRSTSCRCRRAATVIVVTNFRRMQSTAGMQMVVAIGSGGRVVSAVVSQCRGILLL